MYTTHSYLFNYFSYYLLSLFFVFIYCLLTFFMHSVLLLFILSLAYLLLFYRSLFNESRINDSYTPQRTTKTAHVLRTSLHRKYRHTINPQTPNAHYKYNIYSTASRRFLVALFQSLTCLFYVYFNLFYEFLILFVNLFLFCFVFNFCELLNLIISNFETPL